MINYSYGIAGGEGMGAKAGAAAVRHFKGERPFKAVLFWIVGGEDMTLYDINEVAEEIYDICDPKAEIVFGAIEEKDYRDKMRIDLIGVQ